MGPHSRAATVRLIQAALSLAVAFAVSGASTAASAADDLEQHPGKELAQTRGCNGCHYQKAAKALLDSPSLSGQNKAYMLAQVGFIADGTREGKPNDLGYPMTSGMRGAMHHIPRADIEQIVDYYSKLPPAAPVPLDKPQTEAERAAAAKLFSDSGCTSCHGQSGQQPVKPEYPIIVGQTSSYLKRQLENFRDQLRDTGKSELMTSTLHDLTDEQITLLADYLSQIPTKR